MKEQGNEIRSMELLKKVGSRIVKAVKEIEWSDLLNLFLWSCAVNLIIETLGLIKYDGFFGGFISIFISPYIFLYNTIIIMATISISLLFKRKIFVMSLLSVVWLGLGMANFIVLSYRVTPFSAVELKLIDAALGVMKSYVSIPTLVAVILTCAVVIGGIVLIWKKAAVRKKVNYIGSVLIILALALLVDLTTQFGIGVGIMKTQFPNLEEAYQNYGFVYCFSNSLINTGIHKPKNYSSKKVEEIQSTVDKQLGTTATPAATEVPQYVLDDSSKPNIIFLQLESFFDIEELNDVTLSEDLMPNFRRLSEKYSSGFLSVPSVGAGTANTEFEVITGMNLDFFGPGEYPYKTVLKDRTCETICYNLKEHGYKTQAMHNNRATFYGRNEVFSRLGFDVFTSVELMNVQQYTQNGWAKDIVLKNELLKALGETPEKDFIYTISVQGHGSYPVQPYHEENRIKVSGVESEGRKNQLEYYVNQMYEMDQFLNELIEALDALDEKTILVAYGDHLPSLDIKAEELKEGNLFQTKYLIWDNCNLPVEDEDLEAYQLASRVMGKIGVKNGVVNAYHQTNKANKETQEYQDNLKILGYDLLYGNHLSTGGQNIYLPTTIQYGVKNVTVSSVFRDQSDTDYLIIKGTDFTKYSRVMVNDETIESELVDANTLRIRLAPVREPISIIVKQSYKGKLTLQTSNTVVYNGAGEEQYMDGDELSEPTETPSATNDSAPDWGELIDEEAASKNKE